MFTVNKKGIKLNWKLKLKKLFSLVEMVGGMGGA